MSSTKVKKQLKALLKAPDNRFCADCPQKKPTWASINIGVFLCLQCAGIHRDMGVHITKVRSVELDTWKPEWVAVMKKWGNRKANAYWEANCPSGYAGRPTEEEALALSFKLKKFIRDKYDRKLWVAKDGDAVPADSQNDVVSAEESDEIDEEAEVSSASVTKIIDLVLTLNLLNRDAVGDAKQEKRKRRRKCKLPNKRQK